MKGKLLNLLCSSILVLFGNQVGAQSESIKEDSIYRIADQMPRFPGCETLDESNEEKKKCADKKMLEFIYRNIKTRNLEKSTMGVVVVSFIVEKSGRLSNPIVKRSSDTWGEEMAYDLIDKMSKMEKVWTPGNLNGQPVRVKFTLPIKYEL